MIKKITLKNFKCHERLTISLRSCNILVGPNNAGKSTIIDTLRILNGSIGTFKSRKPAPVTTPGGDLVFGYEIPRTSIPVNLDHAPFEYKDVNPRIDFLFENENSIRFHTSPDGAIIADLVDNHHIRSVGQFWKLYPVNLIVVPPLGPFEQQEIPLQPKTVQQGVGTRLSHRHFRNFWLQIAPDKFQDLKSLVENTWDGISISPPEGVGYGADRIVRMFFDEGRTPREVAWSGIGLQVWLQICTYIIGANRDATIVIDEPDIYLHPDMQKRLLYIFRERFSQFIIATHSPEIINEAQNDEIVSIEKGKPHAKRITDIPGLQAALNSIGSNDNIELTKLSRARRIVFFEGNDRSLLKAFARKLGLNRIVDDTETLFLELGGFSQSGRIEAVRYTFGEILKQNVSIFSLFDRDYRCDEEISKFVEEVSSSGEIICMVWEKKEIENYLISCSAIARAVSSKLKRAESDITEINEQEITKIVLELVEEYRIDVFSQRQSARRSYLRKSVKDRRDDATIDKESLMALEKRWKSFDGKISLCPGKSLFSSINTRLQATYGRSITANDVIRAMNAEEVCADMKRVLIALEKFCGG